MEKIVRAYSKESGYLFYEESSLKGVLAEHIRIANNGEVLKQVNFADRESADFIVFGIQTSAQDVEFDVYGVWIDMPEGVSHLGFYKSVEGVIISTAGTLSEVFFDEGNPDRGYEICFTPEAQRVLRIGGAGDAIVRCGNGGGLSVVWTDIDGNYQEVEFAPGDPAECARILEEGLASPEAAETTAIEAILIRNESIEQDKSEAA